MSVVDDREALMRREIKLVLAVLLASPKPIICNEETLCPFGQVGACSIIEVSRQWEGGEMQPDMLDLLICLACLVADRKRVFGVRSGRARSVEGPDCKGSICGNGVRPAHDPKPKGQHVVDPLFRVIFIVALTVRRLTL
jgi:hypothetical protein